MKNLAVASFVAVVLLAASSAVAQSYVAYMPAAPGPVVAYYPPAVSYGPVVTTAYYAPQTVYYAAPTPYYVAAPVATPYLPAPVAVAPVYYGRPVVVRPKVYIPGEPVRNVLRAVTP